MSEPATELDLWTVWLESGHTVEVAAHGASYSEGWLTFKVLMRGSPNREITVAAFPTLAVADWEGGKPFDGKLPTDKTFQIENSRLDSPSGG